MKRSDEGVFGGKSAENQRRSKAAYGGKVSKKQQRQPSAKSISGRRRKGVNSMAAK